MPKRAAQIRMTGMKEFDDKLKQMERKASNRIATQTLAAGTRKAVKAIKDVAPDWMKNGIGARVGTSKKSGRFEAKVGVGVGKRTKKNTKVGWSAAFVVGTRERKTLAGKSTGRIQPHPIVKQGMSAAQGSIDLAMHDKFDKSLAKEVAKAKLNGK